MLKQIKEFDGYFISDAGKFSVIQEKEIEGQGKRFSSTRLNRAKQKLDIAEYLCVKTSTGKRVDVYIHRLVAMYFIPNPENKRYVNYINCIRSDNRVSNLEWCTVRENRNYTMKMNHVRRDSLGRYVSNFSYPDNIVQSNPV